jgi:tripartite-type tricarboxylate transporter receptor subunit TctC
MTTRRTSLQQIGLGLMALGAGPARADDDKAPITMLVGAASSMDFTARILAEQLRQSLDRTAIVVSRLGAGQRLALGEVRRAAPDGRTLVYATSGPFAIYPHIYKKLDYDPDRDFTPIAGISTFDVAIATGPLTGAQDMKQLLAWTRARGSDAVFGSAPGNGSLSHFVGISVTMATQTPMTHIPYKDSGVGIIDVMSGRLPILITGLSPLVEMHKAGKLRIIAVSGDQRSPLVPDVPTLKEAGVNVSSTTSTGVFGPPRMAPELVSRFYNALQPMFANPGVKERLAQQGMTLWQAKPQQLASALQEERKRFEVLVKASGFVPEDA